MSETYAGVPRRGPRWGLAVVSGESMQPTLEPGDRLLVDYRARPRIGAIVVVAFPDGVIAVKRLAELRTQGWWVASDNPEAGVDSRHRGAVPRERILATVRARVWPHPRLVGD